MPPTVIPSTPGLPLLAFTCCNAAFRFSRSHTSSINRFVLAGFSCPFVALDDSISSLPASRASPVSTEEKSSSNWMFCCSSSLRLMAYWPLLSFGPSATVPGSAYPLTPLSVAECLTSGRPVRVTGQSRKEPTVIRVVLTSWDEATGNGSKPSWQWWFQPRSLAWFQVPCAKQWLQLGNQLIPFGRVSPPCTAWPLPDAEEGSK